MNGLEALGELAKVFGSSRTGQEGRKNTTFCECQRFEPPRKPLLPQVLLQESSKNAPGDAPGSLVRASLTFSL